MTHVRCMDYRYFENACMPVEKTRRDWRAEWMTKLASAAESHPRAMWAVTMLGLPVAVVAAVFLATGALMLPLSMLLGWI